MPRPAVADSPLEVETGGAHCPPIDPEGPELCGVISLPDGGDVNYYFELGPTASYGEQIPGAPGTDVSISPGDSTIVVRAKVSGLAPSSIYHFRLFASDGEGSQAGGDMTFKTAAVPEAVPPISSPAASVPVLGLASPIAIPSSRSPLTKAQQLARALKVCQKRPRPKRAPCKVRSRKRYRVALAATNTS